MHSPIIPDTDQKALKRPARGKQAVQPSVVENEANLQAIVEHFDGFVWSIDRDLQYIVLNAALQRKILDMVGKEARPGDKMTDLFAMLDPSMALVWEKICQRGFAGERQRVVEKMTNDGQTIFYEVSINPIRKNEEIVGLSCFARDITEEKLTDQPDGKWSIMEHTGHLSILEPVWRIRVHDILESKPVLTPADLTNQATTEAGFNNDTPSSLLDRFTEERKITLSLLESIDVWDSSKTSLHPRLQQPMRIIDMVYFVAEHDDHHIAAMSNLLRRPD